MIDKNMIALSEIRNDYSLKKYGNLNSEQVSLIKYDDLCLTLIKENQQLKNQLEATKEVALKYLKNEIELKEKLQQRENKNWNELKEWLEDNWKQSQDIWFVKIINKMQEIER